MAAAGAAGIVVRASLRAVVLEAPDARALADFYECLLGWPRVEDHPGWVRLRPPGDVGTGLSFSEALDHLPPVWPATEGEQQMMLHLDISCDDLDAAVALALDGGATLADFQPQPHVRVLLDPAGHPFCLFLGVG